jgi:hypothetical protein
MVDVGTEKHRTMTKIIDEMASFGGLFYLIYFAAMLVYIFFGQPFRDLDFALSSNELMKKVSIRFKKRSQD